MAVNHAVQEISVLNIHDRGLTEDVHVTFSPNNKFIVYGTRRGNKEKDWTPGYLHEVSSKSAIYNDLVRKLANESYGVFQSFNSKMKNISAGNRNNEIAKYCQKYRCIILACMEDLTFAIDKDPTDELLELKDTFTDIELIWHLIQSLIIDNHGTRVVYSLLEWIKWHFVHAEFKMEQITASEDPSSHPEYWDTILQFLLQGKIVSARTLLSLHPKFQNSDFESLDELLRKMPLYLSNSDMSLNEFRIRWKHWQENCKARLQRKEFSSNSHLETICKVLCGDPETLTEISYLCCNWYHLMVSVQFYTDPCVSLSSLGDIARAFYTSVTASAGNPPTLLDTIILAVLELDMLNVIQLSCSFNDSWWFAVHMMDILMHGNFMQIDAGIRHPSEYRNYLLENYAETLISHCSLWEIGVGYFDYCENSRELIEVHLERIPLKTEAKARRMISIAKKRNMENLVKSVANVMIAKAMANGMIGTALSWLSHSRDPKYADELADRWMKDYAAKRKIECVEILRNMGSCMLVSDKLTFVSKYCEFHQLYSKKEFKIAGTLLISLISSEIAPPEFQMILLLDSLPLLESMELTFSRKDTWQLMYSLENVVSSNKKNVKTPDEEKENLIRLAFVRNLARCYVLETGDSETEEL